MNKINPLSKVCSFKSLIAVILVSTLTACSSSGPATSYYSLFPNKEASQTQFPLQHPASTISLGVGPVVLPDYIDYPSVVALTSSAKVKVYGYHAWAGDLDESINRVLVENISNHLQLDSVWRFPWDNRVRPKYQLRIVIESFAGIRGQSLDLVLKWTLLNKSADTLLDMGKEKLVMPLADSSVDAYVQTMNEALNQVSTTIAEKISTQL